MVVTNSCIQQVLVPHLAIRGYPNVSRRTPNIQADYASIAGAGAHPNAAQEPANRPRHQQGDRAPFGAVQGGATPTGLH